jgi:hypothetical protein
MGRGSSKTQVATTAAGLCQPLRQRSGSKQGDSAAKLDGIRNWQDAIKAFPCPVCSDTSALSPGLVKSAGSINGPLYTICAYCQPSKVQTLVSKLGFGKSAPLDVASELITRRYPVRYLIEWSRGFPLVNDLGTGMQVCTMPPPTYANSTKPGGLRSLTHPRPIRSGRRRPTNRGEWPPMTYS